MKEYTLPLDIAKSSIDWYFENNSSRHIRFYGPGEPTLEFETMKKITEYAKSRTNGGNNVTVEIQTNGIFTKCVRDWTLNNINIMWLSFDGYKTIQDYYRPINPSFQPIYGGRTSTDILEENVRWLTRNAGSRNLMIGVRATITNETINKQIEMIDYFYSLGIRYVWTDPLFYAVGKIPVYKDETKLKSFYFDLDRYIDSYISAFHYARDKGMFWGSFFAVNFDGKSSYHCRCCTPLDAPHITPDGYISACDMVVLGAKAYHMNPFIVGKWDYKTNSFLLNWNKILALNNRRSTEMAHCIECPAQMHCGGYCLGETVNETGSLIGQNQSKCHAIVKLFNALGTCDTYDYLHP